MRLYIIPPMLVAILLVASLCHSADDPLAWPHFRGNRDHNGHSDGTGDIVKPAVQGSHKLGGSTSAYKMRFGDFVHGHKPELLIVESGRLYMKTTTNKIIWHTDAIGITDILGVYDLEKDGKDEVITTIRGPEAKIAIFSIKKGRLLRLFDQFGECSSNFLPQNPVVSDINNDGYLELICSARMNDPNSHAFNFSAGFMANAADNLIWEAPQITYEQSIPHLVGDVDGNQLNEVVYLEGNYLTILEGASGQEQMHQPDVFISFSFGPTALINVDSDPELEERGQVSG